MHPEEARARINDWVSEETQDKIRDLLQRSGRSTGNTRLVLTNAIYFHASWQLPFDKRLTRELPFHLAEGGMVEVPMMTETSRDFYGYVNGNGYQAVDVPYSSGEMSMMILLPDEGTFGEFEDSLSAQALERIFEDIEIGHISLTMPLFELESEFSLDQTLSEMGMPDAFGAEADFSGHDQDQGTLDFRSRPQGVRICGRRGHGGSGGHGGGAPGIRANRGDGRPAFHIPHPGQGHGHGPVPGPGDESETVRSNEEPCATKSAACGGT